MTPFFKIYVENEMSDQSSGVVAGAREVTALLDAARARQVEVTSLFLSALAGGLAGALVTVLIH